MHFTNYHVCRVERVPDVTTRSDAINFLLKRAAEMRPDELVSVYDILKEMDKSLELYRPFSCSFAFGGEGGITCEGYSTIRDWVVPDDGEPGEVWALHAKDDANCAIWQCEIEGVRE